MPKTTRRGEPKQSELPSTIRRSGAKAQHTFAKTYDAAADQYGDEERAARTAFAALKHTHEKVGDHWEPKEEYGPSDDQAEGGAGTELAVSGTLGDLEVGAVVVQLDGVCRLLQRLADELELAAVVIC